MNAMAELSPPVTRRRKAAMIVRMMQHAGEALPLASLPDDVQLTLARELGALPAVSRSELMNVAEEFTSELDAMALTAMRGVKGALEALDGQLSPNVAARAAEEAARGDPDHAWARLGQLSEARLAEVMQAESIEISALLMSKLPVAKAAQVMMRLPGERARSIALTTANTDTTPADAMARIAQALFEDYCTAPPSAFGTDAVRRVGAILNSTRNERREEVLTSLDGDAPDFAAKVRRAIFTFANIPERIDPLDVPKITRDLDAETLALAIGHAESMGGDSADAAEFVLSNMSKRMAGQLRETIDEAGEMKPSVGEDAQTQLIQAIRDAIDQGEITEIAVEEEL